VIVNEKEITTNDEINHPFHYTFSNIEVIDVIEDWNLNYHIGNVIKYIARAGKKGSFDIDIKKAIWYIDRFMKLKGREKFDSIDEKVVKYKLDVVVKEWNLDNRLASIVRNIFEGDYKNAQRGMINLFDSS